MRTTLPIPLQELITTKRDCVCVCVCSFFIFKRKELNNYVQEYREGEIGSKKMGNLLLEKLLHIVQPLDVLFVFLELGVGADERGQFLSDASAFQIGFQ